MIRRAISTPTIVPIASCTAVRRRLTESAMVMAISSSENDDQRVRERVEELDRVLRRARGRPTGRSRSGRSPAGAAGRARTRAPRSPADLLRARDLRQRDPVAQEPLRHRLDLLEDGRDRREEVQRDLAVLDREDRSLGGRGGCSPPVSCAKRFASVQKVAHAGELKNASSLSWTNPWIAFVIGPARNAACGAACSRASCGPLLEIERRDDLVRHVVRERRRHLRVGAERRHRVDPRVGVQQRPVRPGVDGGHGDREAS